MILKYFWWLVVITSATVWITSCNDSDLEDLERRLAELEEQGNDTVFVFQTDTIFIFQIDTLYLSDTVVLINDSILVADISISSQANLDLFAEFNIKHIIGTLTLKNCDDFSPLIGLKSVGGLFYHNG